MTDTASPGNWLALARPPQLRPGDVHVWRAALDVAPEEVAELARSLSVDERVRAARFHFEAHRRRFSVARGLLREFLAGYADTPAEALLFEYSAFGKPTLAGHPALQFNLSHSGELALVAVALDTPVGVDVELMRSSVEYLGLASRFFAASEVLALQTLPEAQRRAGFYACWTRKEAFIKAVGEGLSFPLGGFAVSLLVDQPARLLSVAQRPEELGRWTLVGLEPGGEYVGALAVRSECPRVTHLAPLARAPRPEHC